VTISDLQQIYTTHRRVLFGLSLVFFMIITLITNFYQARTQNVQAATYNPAWIKCNQDDACTAIRGACGEWMPVNMDSVENATAYYKRLATMIECVSTIDTPDKPAILCLHEKCTFGVRATE